ncbi:MAG TPA: hypothetical protein VHB70_10010 [Parafilimonas sp.]|nr:hypothetical protein [Parafilimonas sp.]
MLEFFFFCLLMAILFGFQPFTSSVSMPSAVRVPLLLLCTFLTIVFSFKKKKVFYFLLIGGVAFIAFTYVWLRSSPQSLSDIIYVIVLIIFTFCLYNFLKRAPKLFWFICMFWLLFILFVSVFSIASFVAFNFHLAPYKETIIGPYDYYYNPIFGYIHLKAFETTSWGRSCYFMLEPSYLAFFLTTNYFFIDSFPVNPAMKFASKLIVFAGAMSTVSTGAWVVFGLMFGISIGYWLISRVIRNRKVTNMIILGFIIVLLIGIFSIPKEEMINMLGTSSLSDRESRMGESLLVLAGSDIPHILFGNSPAYMEKVFGHAESDQFFKLIVEEGIFITLIVVAFVIYCTKFNFKYMMAVLIFLNSVVLMWTPLFCVNIVLCRILTEPKKLINYKSM